MSDTPRTWALIAELAVGADDVSETPLAALPCLNGPLGDASGFAAGAARIGLK